jgi:hypothetical protein
LSCRVAGSLPATAVVILPNVVALVHDDRRDFIPG